MSSFFFRFNGIENGCSNKQIGKSADNQAEGTDVLLLHTPDLFSVEAASSCSTRPSYFRRPPEAQQGGTLRSLAQWLVFYIMLLFSIIIDMPSIEPVKNRCFISISLHQPVTKKQILNTKFLCLLFCFCHNSKREKTRLFFFQITAKTKKCTQKFSIWILVTGT